MTSTDNILPVDGSVIINHPFRYGFGLDYLYDGLPLRLAGAEPSQTFIITLLFPSPANAVTSVIFYGGNSCL